MDPVSAISLAGSIVGIIDVATRSISSLHALQQRWKLADLTISLLISQLTTLKAALSQIQQWISTNLDSVQHYQLVLDLGTSLESCETLLLFIDEQMTHLNWNESSSLTFESKVKLALQDKTVKECATHLANQSTALNLLLTALNCRSLSEQNDLLQKKNSRRVLEQVEEDSSSLFCLRDPASFRNSLTVTTERSSLLDLNFDFDRELTKTKVYYRQWRPLIRGALRRGRKARESSVKSQKVTGVKLWIPGPMDSPISVLPKAMSLLYKDDHDPELHRGHIYQIVVDTHDAIFDRLSKYSLYMNHDGIAAYTQLLIFQRTRMGVRNLPQWLQEAFVSFWNDPWVRQCYHDHVEDIVHPSATHFLNSIARIVSVDYIPSLEDVAMSLISRNLHSDVLTMSVPMSSRLYNFVTWPSATNLSSECAEELDNLDAVFFIADPVISNTRAPDRPFIDDLLNTVESFSNLLCNSSLAEKDIILVFPNTDKLTNTPLNMLASGSTVKDHGDTIFDIANWFLSFERSESRKIHVILVDDFDKANTLDQFERTVQQILSKKVH